MENNISRTNITYYILIPLLSICYLFLAHFTTGIRGDHFFLVSVVNIGYFVSSFTRRLITGLAIIIVYWIIYDSMKAWPNWAHHSVDIAPLYNLEKFLFGIQSGTNIITPNEFLQQHTDALLDTVTGIFYLSWIPLPLIFIFYLYWKNKNLFLRFCLAFFLVNCIGFIIYYIHPAAPPWYYQDFGNVLHTETKSYAAGLLRFDQLYNVKLFEGIYSKGSNVFAAMPSLHASYPLIGLIYAFMQPFDSVQGKPFDKAQGNPAKFFRWVFFIFMIGIWFSAIYLNHHYILDVLAGITCGLTGVLILERYLLKTGWFGGFVRKYEKIISG